MSKSFIWPAKLVGNSVASKREMGAMPLLPSSRLQSRYDSFLLIRSCVMQNKAYFNSQSIKAQGASQYYMKSG